jgi:hypothetical protein
LLSAASVIEEVNSHYIPVRVNVSIDGYPSEIAALHRVPRDYLWKECNLAALAAVDVFSPGGTYTLGTTGNTVLDSRTAEMSFGDSPDKMLSFLAKCAARQTSLSTLLKDQTKSYPAKTKELRELEQEALQPVYQAVQAPQPGGARRR